MKMKLKGALISTALALGVVGVSPAFAAWEPNKPVEFITVSYTHLTLPTILRV